METIIVGNTPVYFEFVEETPELDQPAGVIAYTDADDGSHFTPGQSHWSIVSSVNQALRAASDAEEAAIRKERAVEDAYRAFGYTPVYSKPGFFARLAQSLFGV